MMPIQDLLNRIRWDPDFGRGEFVIGYFDRVENAINKVPLKALDFDKDNHYAFQLVDNDGELHLIPLHRIKVVYKNGKLIWQRSH